MAFRTIRQKRRKEQDRRRRITGAAILFSIMLFAAAILAVWEVDSSITWLTGRETALQRFLAGL